MSLCDRQYAQWRIRALSKIVLKQSLLLMQAPNVLMTVPAVTPRNYVQKTVLCLRIWTKLLLI